MAVFGSYAQFYDSFYRDKDYAGECDFLEQMFSRHATATVREILDLGCGTGGHVLRLLERGYDVSGVDRSEEMLASARHKAGGGKCGALSPGGHPAGRSEAVV